MTETTPSPDPAGPAPGDQPPGAPEVFAALVLLARRMRQQPVTRPAGMPEQQAAALTGRHLLALMHLAESGPLPAGRLAAALHVAPSTCSGLIADLSAAGLLDRQVDPLDPRRTALTVAAAHADAAAQMVQVRLEPIAAALGVLTAEQRSGLLLGLAALAAAFETPSAGTPSVATPSAGLTVTASDRDGWVQVGPPGGSDRYLVPIGPLVVGPDETDHGHPSGFPSPSGRSPDAPPTSVPSNFIEDLA